MTSLRDELRLADPPGQPRRSARDWAACLTKEHGSRSAARLVALRRAAYFRSDHEHVRHFWCRVAALLDDTKKK
jgi:hypothetical protein